MVYLELFHGRKSKSDEMNDWGKQGPIFGPLRWVHTTYAHHIKLGFKNVNGDFCDLHVHDDLVFYDGWFYGDWSVFGSEVFKRAAELRKRHVEYVEAKAHFPQPATLIL